MLWQFQKQIKDMDNVETSKNGVTLDIILSNREGIYIYVYYYAMLWEGFQLIFWQFTT